MRPSTFPWRFCALISLAVLATGCWFHRRIQKTPYQRASEAYAQAGTAEQLDKTIADISAALTLDPADAQLRLLRASALLRKVASARSSSQVWTPEGAAGLLVADLRRIVSQLSHSSAGLGWVGARAYVVAADLLLLRTQTDTASPNPASAPEAKSSDSLARQLEARALRQLARDFYAYAFKIANDLLKGPPAAAAPVLSTQRDHALEGFLTASAHLAVSDDALDIASSARTELIEAREAALKGRLPEQSLVFQTPISLEPAVHDRDSRVLRIAQPATQTEWLRVRELAFREQVAATFFQEPGRPRLYTADLLEDLLTSLAATRLRWRILPPTSGHELRVRIERHPWYSDYTAPVLDFALYLADKKVLEVSTLEHRPLAADQRPRPVFVPKGGVTLILHAGEPPESASSASAEEVHLYLGVGERFTFLEQKDLPLRLVNGFGCAAASILLP